MTLVKRLNKLLISLFFRIVDVPRRTLAAAGFVMLFLTAASLIRFPAEELARNETLRGGGVCVAGLGWLRPRAIAAARSHCCEQRDTRSGCPTRTAGLRGTVRAGGSHDVGRELPAPPPHNQDWHRVSSCPYLPRRVTAASGRPRGRPTL
jgi:hypothetical protein